MREGSGMGMKPRKFGGKWTEEKLNRVGKYLRAYATIMHKQNFRFAYIDAFAGTGYRTLKERKKASQLLFPELAEKETQSFLAGSARIALEVRPRFTKYIFIEKEVEGFRTLQELKLEFRELASDIEIVNADANAYLKDRCLNYSWKKNRAVLFLDPYGMEVEWETIEAIAKTEAIDLWLLFPLGVAVNRLLRRDSKIDKAVEQKLEKFFGSKDWFQHFYKKKEEITIFGTETQTTKVVDFDGISKYFVKRLREVFAGVAESPYPLRNSKNNPLYLLCFASGNKKGAATAIKIAQDILKG
jgi:three-Cys-motif partner protein